MDIQQVNIVAHVQARLATLRDQRRRYIELANKPYRESTEAENRELLELESVVDSVISIEAVEGLIAIIESVRRLSDVGNLFDGHDELNEFTHEANEKHLTVALGKIHRIVTGKETPE